MAIQDSPTRPEPFATVPLLDVLLVWVTALLTILPALTWVQRWLVLPTGDGAYHIPNILVFQDQFLQSRSPWELASHVLAYSDVHAYPPLGYLVPASLGALLGGLDLAGLASLQVLWVPLTSAAVYLLARKLFSGTPAHPDHPRGRRIALLAAFLVAAEPLMVAYLPDCLLELPTTAMLMVALAALASDPDLERTGPACLAGAAAGLVLLTKWTSLFYLPPALLYVAARVLGQLPRGERARTLRVLGVLGMGLAAAAALAVALPPERAPLLEYLHPSSVLALVGALGLGLLGLARYATRRLKIGPARNLVLAALVACFLASPFYLSHAQVGLDSAAQQVARTTPDAAEHSESARDLVQRPFLLAETLGIPAGFLVAAGLAWLAVAGPRGSFALVGGTLLSVTLVRQAMNLLTSASFDFRDLLPGRPLEILAVVACLLSLRPTRAVATALLLGLGLWQEGNWLAGTTRPELPGHPNEAREVHLDAMAPLVEALAEATGPGAHLVWTVTPASERMDDAVQVLALAQGHPLVLRDWPESPGAPRSLPTWTPVTRLVNLLAPQVPIEKLRALCNGTPEETAEAWILVLAPAGRVPALPPLPGRAGSARSLPAPGGMEARLYPFRSAGPTP